MCTADDIGRSIHIHGVFFLILHQDQCCCELFFNFFVTLRLGASYF